jgi:hypothetical protein
MLTIHEWLGDDGASETVALDAEGGELAVRVGREAPVRLPILALERVMERYGKPLADGIAADGPKLELGDGRALCRIRHRGRYDVIARDFLVWTVPGREPLAELAVAISGALVHLANAAREPSP